MLLNQFLLFADKVMTLVNKTEELFRQNPYFNDCQEPLKPLPYPVYFITKDSKWEKLINSPTLPSVESLYEQCTTGHDIWSAQIYIDLKQQGLNVHLASKPLPGKICVIPYYYLSPKDLLFKSYVVACRYDTPYPALCNQQIVINHSKIANRNCHFLPHRPQPLLKPRDYLRGATIRNLAFKGHQYNLYSPFQSPKFLSELAEIGVTLVTSTEESNPPFADWANYTEADVVLAVRNNTEYDISLKPALKLINAWFAGCPAILGPEPAYQELRQSELDYIEVRTPEEAIAALKYLKQNPEIYLAMIENGFQRAREFTVNATLLQWRNLLAGAIARGYEQWQQKSLWHKSIIRPSRYVGQVIQQRQARRRYLYNIQHGPRVLSGNETPAP